jgi:hypothetical protein
MKSRFAANQDCFPRPIRVIRGTMASFRGSYTHFYTVAPGDKWPGEFHVKQSKIQIMPILIGFL